jgi:hypothetical protein
MSKLSDIIAELASNGSTLTKKSILAKNKDFDVLQMAFWLTENPMLNFYIRLDKNPRRVSGKKEIDSNLLQSIHSTLHGRELTGNAAREWAENILDSLTPEDQVILTRIINRDLECKVGTNLCNATWEGLIPEMPCMLADKFNEKTKKNLKEVGPSESPKIIVQLKCDGLRAHFSIDDKGNVKAFTRSGNELMLHGVFDDSFSPYKNKVIDGELLVLSDDGHEDRKTGNGLGNKSVRGTITKQEAERFSVVVWDVIPFDKFWAGETVKIPYIDRFTELRNIVSEIGQPKKVSLVETKLCRTFSEMQEFYGEKLEQGLEGAIVKTLDMPWENRRSKYMLKLKEELSATLICTGTIPHSKVPGWIGSIHCVTSDGKMKCSIGSGFTEEDREKDPSHFVGRLIDMKYNALITSRGRDEYSMFLPIFKGFREDVNEADTLDKLKKGI